MKGINLLKTKEMQVKAPEDKYIRLRFVAMGLLFIVSSCSVVLFILITFSPLPQLQRQEQEARNVLGSYHKDMAKLSFVNQRTDLAQVIIRKRKSYSPIIEALGAKVPNGVDVTEFKLDQTNSILSASSRSLYLLDELIGNITRSVQEKKDFSQVTLKGLSFERGSERFLLIVQLANL